MERVRQRAHAGRVQDGRKRRGLADQIQYIALRAAQRLDGDREIMRFRVRACALQKIKQLSPRFVDGKARGHVSRRAASKHDDLRAQPARTGKRFFQIFVQRAAVHVRGRSRQRAGKHAVERFDTDRRAVDALAHAREVLVAQPIQRHKPVSM